jgi:hypothetical protein
MHKRAIVITGEVWFRVLPAMSKSNWISIIDQTIMPIAQPQKHADFTYFRQRTIKKHLYAICASTWHAVPHVDANDIRRTMKNFMRRNGGLGREGVDFMLKKVRSLYPKNRNFTITMGQEEKR